MTILLEDEFERLRTGMFSALAGAHTEYHYLPEAAPEGNWNVASFASGQSPGTAWHVQETDDGKELVQTFESKRKDTHPMVIAGRPEWENYRLDTTFTPHGRTGRSGIVFRYRNSRCYYFFGLTAEGARIIKVNHGSGYRLVTEDILASADFQWKTGRRYKASVTVDGEEWEQVEFEKAGKRAIVKNLDLEAEVIRVTLTPIQDTLGPVTVELKPKDFVRKRGKNRVYYMVATRKVKFPPVKVDKPAEPTPDTETEPTQPKPDEDDGDL